MIRWGADEPSVSGNRHFAMSDGLVSHRRSYLPLSVTRLIWHVASREKLRVTVTVHLILTQLTSK